MDTPASLDANPSGHAAGENMEGFVSGYDMPAATAQPSRREEPRVQAAPLSRAVSGDSPARPSSPNATGAGGEESIAAASLSAEALDRLADLVVRRMSERVVREIAWEVIPGVAETVVRERIKELEERES
jgi:hypothetical protein